MIPRKILQMIFSAGLILSFILPWFVSMDLDVFDFKYLMPGNGIAGYEVNRYKEALDDIPVIGKLKEFTGAEAPSPVYYLAFLVPAFGVVCIVMTLVGMLSKSIGLITGAIPMLGFAAMLIRFEADLMNHMTYGAFLTLAFALSLTVTSLTKS